MEVIFGVLVFLFGALVGSFLNVCIYRIPREESISFPPSHCGSCGYFLKPKDLVPIFSYLYLKGKCRYCGQKVSKQYPIIEFITGILFFMIFFKYGFSLELVKFIFLAALLVVVGTIDLKTQYIYTNTIITGLIVAITIMAIEGHLINTYSKIPEYIIGGAITAGVLAIIVVTTGAMGWGDVELMFIIGLFVGLKLSLLTLFLAIVIGGIGAVILLVTKIKNRGDSMAFGPFIAIGAITAILFGMEIINWYISTFFI